MDNQIQDEVEVLIDTNKDKALKKNPPPPNIMKEFLKDVIYS
jgi:hypothetical protein